MRCLRFGRFGPMAGHSPVPWLEWTGMDRAYDEAERPGTREMTLDAALFALATGYVVLWVPVLASEDWSVGLVGNTAVSLAACTALWLRRRHPTVLAAVLIALALVADLAIGALLVALYSVARYRPRWIALPLAGCYLLARAAVVTALLVLPVPTLGAAAVSPGTFIGAAVVTHLAAIAMVAWGLLHRRRAEETAAQIQASLAAEESRRRAGERVKERLYAFAGSRRGAEAPEVSQRLHAMRDHGTDALRSLRTMAQELRAPTAPAPPARHDGGPAESDDLG